MENETLKINESEIDWETWSHGVKIEHKRKNFTKDCISNKLVASLYEIPPGKVSWPFHYHLANEEIFFILAGEGELRTHDKILKVKSGDFLRFPVGEKGVHQLKNTSKDQMLRYLDFGTTNHPDVVFMPDSNKVGLFGGSAPGQSKKNRFLWKYFNLRSGIEYLENE